VPAATLATVLESVHPNPFNPQAAVAFTLAAAGPVRLAVYDLHGTKVNTLFNGNLPAGRHEAVWDGRDDRGQAMASGVYFCKLVANNFSQTKKMVLLK
jgi:flagellar hook assembly protein FlgD